MATYVDGMDLYRALETAEVDTPDEVPTLLFSMDVFSGQQPFNEWDTGEVWNYVEEDMERIDDMLTDVNDGEKIEWFFS